MLFGAVQIDNKSQVCLMPHALLFPPKQLLSQLATPSDWFRNRKAKEQKGKRSRDAIDYPRIDLAGASCRAAQPPQGPDGTRLCP